MARQPGIDVAGIAQHLIQRGVDRTACFAADQDRLFYRSALEKAGNDRNCQIHAYVLMTNHTHLFVTGGQPGCFSTMMQPLGRGYVHHFNSRYHRTGPL